MQKFCLVAWILLITDPKHFIMVRKVLNTPSIINLLALKPKLLSVLPRQT